MGVHEETRIVERDINMELTIAIPTYNRNNLLMKTVVRLLPQLTPNCQLLIIDNCSTIPVEKSLAPLLNSAPSILVNIQRNPSNIGGSANVMRCIELCTTQWLWILGDDDIVNDDAIKKIFEAIEKHKDATFMNFSSNMYTRKRDIYTKGLNDFVDKLDSFSNILLISSGVYNANNLKIHLKYGYMYTYSMAPHFVTLLMALGEKGKCYLSTSSIIHWEVATDEAHWSFISASLGFMTILELPLTEKQRVALEKSIRKSIPRLEFLVNQIIMASLSDDNEKDLLYIYDQIVSRVYYYEYSPLVRLKISLYRFLVIYPLLARLSLRVFTVITRRSFASYTNRFNRL